MTTLVAIVDAIVTDIEANVLSLPSHRTWKYIQPSGMRIDLGPWLVVYPSKTRPHLISSNSQYDEQIYTNIEWHINAFEAAENDPSAAVALAHDALVVVETILARLRTYGAGIPGANGNVGVIHETESGNTSGLQWRWRAVVDVENFA